MRQVLRGALIGIFVLIGILLISNLDKGVQRFVPDQLHVQMERGESLAASVAKVTNTKVLDPEEGLVQVPYGQTDAYQLLFLNDLNVQRVNQLPVAPTFSLKQYGFGLLNQLRQYRSGSLGSMFYESKSAIPGQVLRVPEKEYSINPLLLGMIERSFSYLIPALLTGVVGGYLVALSAVWKPRWGRIVDVLHALLLSLPDFFIVGLLQLLGILLAKAAGHNVIPLMQVADTVPFLIPFLAISILPGALVYGSMRLAVAREWEEGYIKTAYSKGLNRSKVLLVHILRNTTEDLLSVLPRTVSVSITSLVVAEVMTHIFGLGGYVVNEKILTVSSLPVTCAILALIALSTHVLMSLLHKRLVVNTKEGA